MHCVTVKLPESDSDVSDESFDGFLLSQVLEEPFDRTLFSKFYEKFRDSDNDEENEFEGFSIKEM